MRRRRQSEPVAIGALLPRLLHDLGLGASARILRIAERWAGAVGPEVALRSQPLALRGDELEVGVESSVWCQQLQLQAPELLARLRAALGDDAPSKLRFRLAKMGGDERR